MKNFSTKSVFIAFIAIMSVWNLNAQQTYTITISTNPPELEGAGTIPPSGTHVFEEGFPMLLLACPSPQCTFINWTENGEEISEQPVYCFAVTEDRNLVANFIPATCNITLSANPPEGGTVSGSGTYGFGSLATIIAIPKPNYEFLHWTDEDGEMFTSIDILSFAVTKNLNLTAHFGIATFYNITLSANPPEGGTVAGGGVYEFGSSVTVTAIPKPNYVFLNWTENGNLLSILPDYSFFVHTSRNLVANFAPSTLEITLSNNIEGIGILHGAGTYNYGQMAIVYATNYLPEYMFNSWTEDGNIVSYGPIISAFPVTKSRHLVANFSGAIYEIPVYAHPYEGGTVTGGGQYPYGAFVTISAKANPEYKFLNWTKYVLGVGIVVSTDPDYTYQVTGEGNMAFRAYFTPGKEDELSIEPIDAGAMMIYPNPTTGELRIDASAGSTTDGGGRIKNVEIFDVYGKKVYQKTINQFQDTLQLSELAQGTYILKVYLDQGDVITWKVVKN